MTNEELISDMKWAELAFQRVLGVVPKYYRPPHGSIDDRVRKVVKLLGYVPLMWDMSTRDTRILNSTVAGEATFEQVWAEFQTQLNATRSNEGTIFLQHDTFEHTVEYLSRIIPAVRQRQLQFATVAECVGDAEAVQRFSDFNVTDNWKKDFDGQGTGELTHEKSSAVAVHGLASVAGPLVFAVAIAGFAQF
ncbi:MAG: hypothetical protein BJ554DRAFT_7148 [Olpidium bornovanus]|uniref:NodB homology domain-containing protein n=1 Tax=Olpidium bornovanus TaxID=278681 RepID=A0A8H8DK48_9FUNG|nr:MAG: hypothetical protein BJ554DRAFT_7148 [Olpidium bornovanus]